MIQESHFLVPFLCLREMYILSTMVDVMIIPIIFFIMIFLFLNITIESEKFVNFIYCTIILFNQPVIKQAGFFVGIEKDPEINSGSK